MTERTELSFPEDLVLLWNVSHFHQSEATADGFEDKWKALQDMLSGYIKKNLPGFATYQDAQDAASDYIIHLLSGNCPDNVISHSALIANMRKYLAMKREPVQYELNQILHAALRKLEKIGLVKRDENSIGKRISGKTLFLRTDSKNNFRSWRNDYERNRKNVPVYKSVIRANDPEHSRIIPPASAKELVLKLLDAFGGWTETRDLLWAMQFHVPDQLQFVPEQKLAPVKSDSNSPAVNPINNLPEDRSETFIYDFDHESGARISAETAQRIWNRVSKVSDKVFCLYSLPNFSDLDCSTKLEDFGPTSTVYDQNRDIMKIMQDELKNYIHYFNASSREKLAIKAVLNKISSNLYRNCSEKGYNMPLLSDKTGKEQ